MVMSTSEWTKWLALSDVAPVLAAGTQQDYDGVCRTLRRLAELDLLQWGQDDNGGLWFRVRSDDAARTLARLDDLR